MNDEKKGDQRGQVIQIDEGRIREFGGDGTGHRRGSVERDA